MAIQADAPCGLEKPITKRRTTEQKGNKRKKALTDVSACDRENGSRPKSRPSLNRKLKISTNRGGGGRRGGKKKEHGEPRW
jgi:hypothetical protein